MGLAAVQVQSRPAEGAEEKRKSVHPRPACDDDITSARAGPLGIDDRLRARRPGEARGVNLTRLGDFEGSIYREGCRPRKDKPLVSCAYPQAVRVVAVTFRLA